MCGRFTRASKPRLVAEELGVTVDDALAATPRYNVCPGEAILVVARGRDELRAGWMRWGLVPWFARDPHAGPRSINARAETLATARPFRDAFRRRRCLIVADGFYEWRRAGADRVPYFIRLRSRRPFVMAGVWDRWTPPDGAPLLTCAIVTCTANGVLAPIHDRMPVIVPREARDAWLAPGEDASTLASVLRPYPDEALEAYAVSRLVNSPRNDAPECILPLAVRDDD